MKIAISLVILLIALAFPTLIAAQVITAFNFQGRLNDGSSPANGQYDLQFKLFDAVVGGSQIGSTLNRPNLTLVNGVFSTTLNFGSAPFASGNRFLEISVRPLNSPNAYVVLGSRQQILSVPLAVRAASADHADNATNAQNSVNAQNATNATNAINSQNAIFAQDAMSLGGHSSSSYARLNSANSGDLSTTGRGGFGTSSPNTRLTLSGGPPWTSSQWTASMNMQNASALGWEANTAGQRFGIGQTNGGLYFFRTNSAFGSTQDLAHVDMSITDSGNLTQPRERNGMMKLMAAITAGGNVVRCYNAVTGSSAGNCGIGLVLNETGNWHVTLPFQVSDRFWIVTPDESALPPTPGNAQLTASVGPFTSSPHPNVLSVTTFANGSRTNIPFHLFIY